MKRSSKQAEAAPTSEALAGQVASLERELSAVAHELTLADPADVERGTQLQARKLALLAAREAAQSHYESALEAERQAERERQAEALAAERAALLAVVDEHVAQLVQCTGLLADALAGFDAAVVDAQLRGATPSLETMAPIESLRRGLKLAGDGWAYQQGLATVAARHRAGILAEALAAVERCEVQLRFAQALPGKAKDRDRLINGRVLDLLSAERRLAVLEGRPVEELTDLEIEARQKKARSGALIEFPSLGDFDAAAHKVKDAFLRGK